MAIAPVVLQFMAAGLPDVQRAYRSIERMVTQSERTTTGAVASGSRSKERAYQQLSRDAQRWHREQVRSAEKSVRDEVRSTEKATKDKARLEERAARDKVRIMNKVDGDVRRIQDKAVRDTSRAEAAKVRIEQRAIRERDRLRERSASMAGQFASKQAREEASAAKRAQAQMHRDMARDDARSAKMTQRYMNAVGAGVSNGASLAARGIGGVARTMATLGGGFSISDSLQENVNLERQAALLANKAPAGTRTSTADIIGKARAASISTGTDADKLLGAWGAYTDKSGDFEGGEKNMEFFGRVAKATGSDIGQIATSAGLLRVQNKGLDEGKMKQLILDVVQQGRSGAVDMPELASHASAITKTSSSYAGDQTTNQRKLLALSQIGVRTGSVSEAATMLSNISGDATKHADDVERVLGKGTFNEKGQIAKAPEEFLADVLEKTGGNRMKIQGMGFGQRSLKMFDALLPTYNKAEEDALKGGASKADATKVAKAAALADMTQFTNATYDEKGLNNDFANVMKTSAEQFEGAVRQLKAAVGDKLVPELVKLVPLLVQLTPPLSRLLEGLVKMADWVSTHPFEGLALTIGAAVTKEIVAAQIGATIKSLLTGGGGAGGVVANGAGVAGGAGGPGAVGALGGASILAGVLASGVAAAKVGDTIVAGGVQGEKDVAALKAAAAAGKTDEVAAGIAAANANSGTSDWITTAMTIAKRGGRAVASPLAAASDLAGDYAEEKATGKGPGDLKQVERTIAAQEVASREVEINEAAKKLATALTNAANTVSVADPNADSRNKPLDARGGTK